MIPVAAIAGGNLFYLSLLTWLMIVTALALAVKKDIKGSEIVMLSRKLPAAFAGMIKALFTSQMASKKFIHTPHNIQS
jgi:hypothetical protein